MISIRINPAIIFLELSWKKDHDFNRPTADRITKGNGSGRACRDPQSARRAHGRSLGLSSSNLADTFWGLGSRSPNSMNWSDKRGMQWCSCSHFCMVLRIKIWVLTTMTATAFLGHEALEFASERLKAEVLNVETAMRDWTALGFAVNCWSETRFRKGIWLMTCIRRFLFKLPLRNWRLQTEWSWHRNGNLMELANGERRWKWLGFLHVFYWSEVETGCQCNTLFNPSSLSGSMMGGDTKTGERFFLGLPLSSLGVSSVLLAFLCLNAYWIAPILHLMRIY